MAFKMKGFSGFKNVAKTGYAGSSAFQQKKGGPSKSKEELLAEGFTPANADQMIKDGATTGKQDSDKQQSSTPEKISKQQTSKIGKKVIKAKKSTTSAHGQLSDAEEEYKQDKKILANKNSKMQLTRESLKKKQDRKILASNNEYQKNFKGNEKSGSSGELKAFQADLKEALANKDAKAAKKIRMDLATSNSEMQRRRIRKKQKNK